MNAGMKLTAVYVAGAILVAGCGQSNSGSAGTSPSQPAAPAQSQSSQSSPQKFSVNSIDGYKSFKFGMKPSELAKLAECAPNDYDDLIAAKIVKLENYLPNTINSSDRGATERINKQIEELKNNKEGSYIDVLHCEVDFAGEKDIAIMNAGNAGVDAMGTIAIIQIGSISALTSRMVSAASGKTPSSEAPITFFFNGQERLGAVAIPLGTFNQVKIDNFIKQLSEKYTQTSSPTDVDIAKESLIKS